MGCAVAAAARKRRRTMIRHMLRLDGDAQKRLMWRVTVWGCLERHRLRDLTHVEKDWLRQLEARADDDLPASMQITLDRIAWRLRAITELRIEAWERGAVTAPQTKPPQTQSAAALGLSNRCQAALNNDRRGYCSMAAVVQAPINEREGVFNHEHRGIRVGVEAIHQPATQAGAARPG
jgi:hypothetical protein